MDSGEEELHADILFADQNEEQTDLEKEVENPISDFSRKNIWKFEIYEFSNGFSIFKLRI